MKAQEIWKPVVGYEDFYEVSNFGRVKSLNYNHTGKEGILKPSPDGDGYLRVTLCKNGEKEPCRVHQLIMREFVGECPENHQVDHFDWNPKNNRLDNLRYLPAEENNSRKSPEWRKNIAEANKKKAQDPEWLEKMQKLFQDPEWRKNVAEANRRLAQDPEWQKNHTEAMQKLAQDPEWLGKVREGAKRRAADPEWQKNHTEAMQKLAQDPEWRKKQAEATKKACCKPVDQFTLDGQFVKTWASATDAANELDVNRGHITECCNGKLNKTGGYIWRYAVCST